MKNNQKSISDLTKIKNLKVIKKDAAKNVKGGFIGVGEIDIN